MTNVLFSRGNFSVTDTGRSPMAYEVEIKNVNLEGLTKDVEYAFEKPKMGLFMVGTGEFTEEVVIDETTGEETIVRTEIMEEQELQAYLLPQSEEVVKQVVTKVETTEETAEQVMVVDYKYTPVLDENGEHKFYYPTHIEYEQVDTGEVDEFGEPIYETVEKEVASETPIYLYTSEELQVQKKNEAGELLFYKEVTEEVTETEERAPIEISEKDERFTEGLKKALEVVKEVRQVSFIEGKHEFNYQDIVEHKKTSLLNNSLFVGCELIEDFQDNVIDSFANFGLGFVNIPVGGFIATKLIGVQGRLVGLYKEASSSGLTFSISEGDLINFREFDSSDEGLLAEGTTGVYLRVENKTDKAIDLHSLGIMW